MTSLPFVEYAIFLIIGFFLGFSLLWFFHRIRLGSYDKICQDLLQKAQIEAESQQKANEIAQKQLQVERQRELDQFSLNERRKIQREAERLKQREDKIESRMNLVEKKLSDIEKREAVMAARKTQLDDEKKHIADLHLKLIEELEKIGGLSSLEAREQLLQKLTQEAATEAANLIRRRKKEAEEEADKQASTIIATAISRLAVSCVSEATVNTVSIPNEEMKGRIIGREGRNIRALERATGINFIIDDTPGAVVLSGFDPVRLHIAKAALSDLVLDGRIHPTRIEEAVEKARVNVIKQIKAYGEDAALRAGAINMHHELIMLLGKLKFRFSYGQNVLDHSLEVSYLMGIMAAELGLDQSLARRIGLLHDIGKAVSHEVEGSHAIIGHDIALRCGESKEIANGIGCHHFEMESVTVEGSLCSSADAISASRQGARSEPVEEYICRLKKLEDLALELPGVEKAYAMQAGREIRVIVKPDMVDDEGVVKIAKNLSKNIEEQLQYPGKIRVTVIREKRIVEYAV
jgi:ribonuclease Y